MCWPNCRSLATYLRLHSNFFRVGSILTGPTTPDACPEYPRIPHPVVAVPRSSSSVPRTDVTPVTKSPRGIRRGSPEEIEVIDLGWPCREPRRDLVRLLVEQIEAVDPNSEDFVELVTERALLGAKPVGAGRLKLRSTLRSARRPWLPLGARDPTFAQRFWW